MERHRGRPRSRTRRRRRRRVPAVFFVGRHEPRKGLASLLDAWSRLDRDAVLWVASTGPQTKELRKRKVANVEWLGSISDPRARAAHARRDRVLRAVAARRVVRRGAARGDGGGHADRRVRDRGVRERRPTRPRSRARRAGRGRRPAATRCAAPSTTPRSERDSSKPAGRVPRSSRWRDSPSATSSSTRKRSSPRREHDCTRSVSEIEELALDTAARVRDAVAPSLGDPGARKRVGVAPGGDVTMAIDEVAEEVVAQCLAARGRHRVLLRGPRLRGVRRSARDLRRRPGRRHPTGRGRARVLLRVDRGRAAAARRDARRRVVRGGARDQERRPFSTRAAAGRRARRAADGRAIPRHRSENTDLGALFWTAGLRGRPVVPVSIALEPLIDGRRCAAVTSISAPRRST